MVRVHRLTVIIDDDVLIFLSTSRFRGLYRCGLEPGTVLHDFALPCAGTVLVSLQHMQRMHQDRVPLRSRNVVTVTDALRYERVPVTQERHVAKKSKKYTPKRTTGSMTM